MDYTTFHNFMQYPVVNGALTGLVAAAVVDIAAFRSWKSVDEAKTYDWGVAGWRWFQGLVSGALAGLGLSAV